MVGAEQNGADASGATGDRHLTQSAFTYRMGGDVDGNVGRRCRKCNPGRRHEWQRYLRALRSFPVEQRALALDAPGIARERPIFPNDAVAGNGDGEIVRRACAGDRPHGFRRADASCDLVIGNGFAEGNVLQGLPYTLLEGSAANVERKIQPDPRRLNEADNSRDERLIVAIGANEMRFRKAVLEIADEFVRVVSQ